MNILPVIFFAFLGFKTQETLPGTYIDSRGKEKVVVACKDFVEGGKRLLEFAEDYEEICNLQRINATYRQIY